MIVIALFIVIALILYATILGPYLTLLKLKFQLGNKAEICFYPVLGWFPKANQSGKKYGDAAKFNLEIVKRNPDTKILLTNFGTKPMLFFLDPTDYKQMYLEHEVYEKQDFTGHDGLITKGLVFESGTKWKKQRQLLGNPFRYDRLKARLPMMNEVIREKCDKTSKEHVLEFMASIAGEIVLRSFFGPEVKGLKLNGIDAQVEISRLINEAAFLQMSSVYVFLKQLILGQKSWKFLPITKEREIDERICNLKFTSEKIVQQRIMNRKLIDEDEEKENSEKDFLDIYLDEYFKQESQKDITIDEITQQFITFFFAGTDTTAHQSSICAYYLGQYPEIQQELYDEVISIVGKVDDVTEHHLPKLVKLSAFISETLRIRNTALFPLIRKARNTHFIQGVKVERGWYVVMGPFLPSNQEKYFDNPEEFNYKRWLQPNPIKNDNGYVYVPFSAGPRNCIGQHMALMEIKIILCHLLRRYEITIDPTIKFIWEIKFLYAMDPDTMIQFKERK